MTPVCVSNAYLRQDGIVLVAASNSMSAPNGTNANPNGKNVNTNGMNGSANGVSGGSLRGGGTPSSLTNFADACARAFKGFVSFFNDQPAAMSCEGDAVVVPVSFF